jgi:hypothetical protein
MVMGAPKAGKTGALASLVNSGRFNVRILDFDKNPDPLYTFVSEEHRNKVSLVTLDDNLRDSGKKIGVSGEPVAFRNACRAIDKWVDDEGQEFGAVKEWGTDCVLVLDSLTAMGEAAFRRRRHYRPAGSTGDDNISDWGAAMRDQSAFLEILASPRFSCHILVLSHVKTLEPKIIMESSKDSQDVKDAKAAISLKRAEKHEIHNYPSALGNSLPPEIARFLPGVVLVDGNRGGRRVILTGGEDGYDLGIPAKGAKRSYPLETGLLDIFNSILATPLEPGATDTI